MSPTSDSADLVVVGGGLGGVAAALGGVRLGLRTILVSDFSWLGGQLTTQAVPPDEHPWMEGPLVPPSYRSLRERVREHYRRNYPLTAEARSDPALNPGQGLVSGLCHEPRVAAIVLEEMVSAATAGGLLTVLRGYRPVSVDRSGRTIASVTVRAHRCGRELRLHAPTFVDATELGDLLALGEVEHVIGAESAAQTGELHAPQQADPLDQQAVTWCLALELRPGSEHTIERPARYEYWRDRHDPRWPGPQFSWTDVDPQTLRPRTRPMLARDGARAADGQDRDLWHFRRILAQTIFTAEFPGGDVTLVNWPQVDYWDAPLLGVDPAAAARARAEAHEMSWAFLYWLQTEAPRHDGGHGYPELRPRPDVMGSPDGLAQDVYIREARRIRARFTVTEAHIGVSMRGDQAGAAVFEDSVGIGYYRIDLHPSTAGRSYVDIDCFPFQIPLGALISRDVDNLLPAAKNIGTTHITNGAYRLHPVEWSIGEAAGTLSAYCHQRALTPAQAAGDRVEVAAFQRLLREELGVPLEWPDDIRRNGPALRAEHYG